MADDTWIQSEVNVKALEDGTPVASEVGWIVYTEQETADACQPAIDFAVQL
ncbi:MAG: hypothetical protein MJE77_22160 [Proteobacteria bacterium]|nr:hypothetical protein [Pseudomonadota bacterium]